MPIVKAPFPYHLDETSFGFDWGPAIVERVVSDERHGVVICVRSPRGRVDIRVTPSGKIVVTQERAHG